MLIQPCLLHIAALLGQKRHPFRARVAQASEPLVLLLLMVVRHEQLQCIADDFIVASIGP